MLSSSYGNMTMNDVQKLPCFFKGSFICKQQRFRLSSFSKCPLKGHDVR